MKKLKLALPGTLSLCDHIISPNLQCLVLKRLQHVVPSFGFESAYWLQKDEVLYNHTT